MKYRIIIVGIVVLLTLAACNRFDNSFAPEQEDTSFVDRINDFSEIFSGSLSNENIAEIMDFFGANYLNDGKTKDDVQAYFQDIAGRNPDSVFVSILDSDKSGLTFTYTVLAFDNSAYLRNQVIIADTTITEYTAGKATNYLIIGNQLEASGTFDEMIDAYQSQLTASLMNNDIAPVMAFFADDFLYNGKTKADVEALLRQIADHEPQSVDVTILSTDFSGLTFSYNLKADNNTAIIDTTIVEYLSPVESSYLIVGNGQDEVIVQNRRVLVELFTARLCPNCPYVEAALYNLKQEYGDKFFYIEYHMQNPLNFGNQDIAGYYGITSQPFSIIQGQTQIRGGSQTESYSRYESAITSFFDIEADFIFSGFDYSVGAERISFSLQVTTTVDNIPSNLKFKYALVEKVSSVNNLQGQPFRNVTISKGEKALQSDMFNILDNKRTNIEIEFDKPDFDFNSSPTIVVWLQTIEQVYDDETCIVHNVDEYPVDINN